MATRETSRRAGLRCAAWFAILLALSGAAGAAELGVADDAGRVVVLAQPARRIVSLAPHLTELLFAAGAGRQVVGTVEYSNYPPEARQVARIGDSAQLDLERIVALKPDLVVVWRDGNAQRQLEKLLHLGIPVFYNEPRRLADIARSIEQLGRLAGTDELARPAAGAFLARAAALRRRYAGRDPVRLFFQIWDQPLMTINGEHLISDVIRMCGGQNVFGDLGPLTPKISVEAVLAADPEAIGGGSAEAGRVGNLNAWKRWSRLTAVVRGNLFLIDSDLISRNTPRILDAAEQLCEHLAAARSRREPAAR